MKIKELLTTLVSNLLLQGYNHCGTETFYSGVTGEPLRCEIFFGIVYYQRLRHMVKDKAQVRSTGPINALTRQPVQGRKKGGGVRFGEMERDSLLAHGASFLLNDRLMNSSDRHIALVCKKCGSILAPTKFSCTVCDCELIGKYFCRCIPY
jgi:DNA-directed RNA polymerase I subunit RPA2